LLEISKIVKSFTSPKPSQKFQPTDVDLQHAFPPYIKENDDIPAYLDVTKKTPESHEFSPVFPKDKTIIAIDSTGFKLGVTDDGIVGSVRLSVIYKKPNESERYLDSYGPYIFMIDNQNKEKIYQNLFYLVYGTEATQNSSPEPFKMLDRVRNLLERHIQMEVIKTNKNCIILLDGSLIGNTIANPGFFINKMIDEAYKNNNGLVAISKFTKLTLRNNGKSILSLCESDISRNYRGPLNGFIEGDQKRYLGDIYVGKLSSSGEPFRIDIPQMSIIPIDELFSNLAGIVGYYGYPEELKLAHSTSVYSSIEILELQAAAINQFNMQIEENLRKKLFAPF
jgi:hypothetical protein